MNDIAIIVPSLNPDKNLTNVVEGMSAAGFDKIILVDDGSDEAHKEPFRKAAQDHPGTIVLVHDVNKGKGRGMKTAFSYILENMPDKGAAESLKVLKSAIANAENNMGKNAETLYVKEAYATSGPQFKRMSARAKGSGNVILKKTSHITIVLDEVVGG